LKLLERGYGGKNASCDDCFRGKGLKLVPMVILSPKPDMGNFQSCSGKKGQPKYVKKSI